MEHNNNKKLNTIYIFIILVQSWNKLAIENKGIFLNFGFTGYRAIILYLLICGTNKDPLVQVARHLK